MVRHCGRPPALPAGGRRCRAPPPRPPSVPRRPCSPEPRPAASVPLPGGGSPACLSLPPSPLPARAQPLRESRGGGAEPGLVGSPGEFGARGAAPVPLAGARRGWGRRWGGGRGGGNGLAPAPLPAPLCLVGDWGLGFRVSSLPPPRSRGFPLRPAGEKERLSRRASPSSAPGSNTPQVSQAVLLGAGYQPFSFLHHLSRRPMLLEKESFPGQLVEVIFTSLLKTWETAELGGGGTEVQPVLIS